MHMHMCMHMCMCMHMHMTYGMCMYVHVQHVSYMPTTYQAGLHCYAWPTLYQRLRADRG